jgi:hypothetical protein
MSSGLTHHHQRFETARAELAQDAPDFSTYGLYVEIHRVEEIIQQFH